MMFTRFASPKIGPNSDTRRAGGKGPLATVAAAALSVSLLAGCSAASSTGQPDTGEPAAGGSEEMQDFTFLSYLPMTSLSMVPEMMAVAGGYFEKHGLDVEIQEVAGSPQAMQLLLAGSGDLTRVGALDVYSAAGPEDMPMVNVATLVRSPSIKMLYSAKSPLEEPEDFVGKTVGVPSEGGSSSKTINLMLKNSELDPASVEQQVVGLTPATFKLVQNGTLAGYMVSHDTALIASSQNEDARIYDFAEATKAGAQLYVATPETIENESSKVKKYLAAIEEATSAIVDDAADGDLSETIETLRTEYQFTSLMDDEIAAEGLKEQVRQWTNGGESPLLTTDMDEWTAGYEELVNAEMIPGGDDPTEWATNSLLSE